MNHRQAYLSTFQIVGSALLLVACLTFWLLAPWREWIQLLSIWLQGLGFLGLLFFGVVYVPAVILLAPSWPLTVAAGLIYGFWGIPIVILFATLGATAAFVIARYAVREWVAGFMRGRPVFLAIDRAIEQQGTRIVLLLRLSPAVPFNLQNYFFGATKIGFLPYVGATFFGIMPGTAVYVYLGTLGKAVAVGDSLGAPRIALLGIGLIATFAVVLIIMREAKHALKEAVR